MSIFSFLKSNGSFFIVILLTTSCSVVGQQGIVAVTDNMLVSFLNNGQLLDSKEDDELSIRIWELDRDSGSAQTESCEVLQDIYITRSEFGEYPEQRAFLLGPFYSFKIENWIIHNSEIGGFSFSHLLEDTRESMVYLVDRKEKRIRQAH